MSLESPQERDRLSFVQYIEGERPFACRRRRRLVANTSRKSMREASPLVQNMHRKMILPRRRISAGAISANSRKARTMPA